MVNALREQCKSEASEAEWPFARDFDRVVNSSEYAAPVYVRGPSRTAWLDRHPFQTFRLKAGRQKTSSYACWMTLVAAYVNFILPS